MPKTPEQRRYEQEAKQAAERELHRELMRKVQQWNCSWEEVMERSKRLKKTATPFKDGTSIIPNGGRING